LVAYVVEKIVRDVAPQRIILFGSRSRGQETEASDLDLFVIQDSGRSNRQVRRQIESLLCGRRFGIDLIVATPEQVERNVADGNPFYTRHILGEGKVLYDREASEDRDGKTGDYSLPQQTRSSPGWQPQGLWPWGWLDAATGRVLRSRAGHPQVLADLRLPPGYTFMVAAVLG
jgi:predicted nucleotidyltransferase